jgi:hypothetical protein
MDVLDEEDEDSPTPMRTFNAQNSYSHSDHTDPFHYSNVSSSFTTPRVAGAGQGDGDANMAEDPSMNWLSMDLDALLAQSLPPLDMSLYQSMGDLAPIHSNTVPYGQDDFSSYLFPGVGMDTGQTVPTSKSATTPLIADASGSQAMLPVTPEVRAILSAFCESCCNDAP